jgi:hypothetical protein
VRARNRIAVALAAATLLAGCGGGGDDGGEKAKPGGPPKANEPLAAAATRLERLLPRQDCKELSPLMLHSVQWAKDPDAPPTAEQCRHIRDEGSAALRGFKLARSRQFGVAGFSEGTGARAQPGNQVGILWVLDTDGSWKVTSDALFRPQIGVNSQYGARADANARRFVTAVGSGDCDELWRLLNLDSRFVDASRGNKAKLCSDVARQSKVKSSGFAQIKADRDAKPQAFGKTRDLAFYGVGLENGRYLALVLAGPLAGHKPAEYRQHEIPSVLEFVTVRR